MKSGLRLIVITSSASQGGAERQLKYLIESLSQVEIVLIVAGRGAMFDDTLDPHITTISAYRSGRFSTLKTIFTVLVSLWRIRDSASYPSKPVVIQGWLEYGNLLAYISRLIIFRSSWLVFAHRSSFFLNQSFMSQSIMFASLAASFLCRQYKSVHIANSRSIYKFPFSRIFIPSSNAFVVDNCFPKSMKSNLVGKYAYSPIVRNRDLDQDLRLLYVARFSPEKRHSLLFRYLETVNFSFKLTCIGSGCTFSNKHFAKLSRGIRHKLTAIETATDLESFYSSSDFTLLFSRSESFPNVLAESLLSSTPCISFNVGESVNIIGDAGFIISDVGDVLFTLNQAHATWKDPEKYRILREKAYLRGLSMQTPDECAKRFSEIYASL